MKKFKEFLLEVSHGDHVLINIREKGQFETLNKIINSIHDRNTLIKIALNCLKDANFPEHHEYIILIEKWLKDEVTGEQINFAIDAIDMGFNSYSQDAIIATLEMLYEIHDINLLTANVIWNICWAIAIKQGNNYTKQSEIYFEMINHYIAMTQGISGSFSKYKSPITKNLNLDNDFINNLVVMFDQIEEKTPEDEEPLVFDVPDGKVLNMPEFRPPMRIFGKDNFDLAEKIYNSKFKYSILNYLKHIHT